MDRSRPAERRRSRVPRGRAGFRRREICKRRRRSDIGTRSGLTDDDFPPTRLNGSSRTDWSRNRPTSAPSAYGSVPGSRATKIRSVPRRPERDDFRDSPRCADAPPVGGVGTPDARRIAGGAAPCYFGARSVKLATGGGGGAAKGGPGGSRSPARDGVFGRTHLYVVPGGGGGGGDQPGYIRVRQRSQRDPQRSRRRSALVRRGGEIEGPATAGEAHEFLYGRKGVRRRGAMRSPAPSGRRRFRPTRSHDQDRQSLRPLLRHVEAKMADLPVVDDVVLAFQPELTAGANLRH
jgi:hypothetical protein